MSVVNDVKQAIQGAVQGVLAKSAVVAPGDWLPGGKPDPLGQSRDGLIGAPVSRLDGPLKVQGKATFAAEFPMDNMVYAALAFSTIAKGRIATLDTNEAETSPGVVLVMTYLNAPHMEAPPAFLTSDKAASGDDLPVMQNAEVHWNGQPIALVLAETQEQADYATSLIRATYEVESATTSFAEAKAKGTETGSFMGPLKDEIGDAEEALKAASVSIDNVYRTPRHSHNALELHAATLAWIDGSLLVHDGSQGVTAVAWSLGQIFGMRDDQVHVTSPYVGGAFGAKFLWQHQILAAAAAKLANRPVRIALSRKGVYRIVGGRTLTEQRVAIGATSSGKFDALIQTGIVTKTRHNALPEPFINTPRAGYPTPPNPSECASKAQSKRKDKPLHNAFFLPR
jgi:xanthine dehydrogenase YagR molybdenum-binding subunit